MRVRFDGVNFNSNSGPNGFSRKLKIGFESYGIADVVIDDPDVQLSFIQNVQNFSPTVLRLDGIYFDSKKDWRALNSPILKSYDNAAHVVFQTDYNKRLCFEYFGKREKTSVILNGTQKDYMCIPNHDVIKNSIRDRLKISDSGQIWMCASEWREHKRLKDNIRYFLEFSNETDILVVAGRPDKQTFEKFKNNDRIKYVGMLDRIHLEYFMKEADYFIHLAFLDNCPNVVVDAQACGCHVIFASSGGTKEIVSNGTMIEDFENWDFSPIDRYKTPMLDFSKRKSWNSGKNIDIYDCAMQYKKVFNYVTSKR